MIEIIDGYPCLNAEGVFSKAEDEFPFSTKQEEKEKMFAKDLLNELKLFVFQLQLDTL